MSAKAQEPTRRSCPLCGSPQRQLEFLKQGWQYWRCSCGHVFVDPLPSYEQTLEHYQQGYSDEQLNRSRAWFKVLARDRLKLVQKWWGNRPTGHLVDAGCGYGFFLNEARNRGWSVTGIDYSGHPLQFAGREFDLDIIAEDIGIAIEMLPKESVDVLTFWHVLEHLNRPGRILDHAVEAMKPGGILILNSPNLDAAIYRLAGRYWSWIYTPGHVQYFSLGSLADAVEGRGLSVQAKETWTHAPNLYFLLEDALLQGVCDALERRRWLLIRKVAQRLRQFAFSPFHQQVLQLRFFKVLYGWTPGLDRHLRRAMRGHEFLLVARKA
ncbi:MAG: class I SAM-dependent methyltransferase [Acidobacteriota bacterium]